MKEVGDVAFQMNLRDVAHVSHSLPRKGSGIEDRWDKFDPTGKPIFEGSGDVREFIARTEGLYDYD